MALQNDPGLRLEIMVYVTGDSSLYKMADHHAAELGFYLKNTGLDVLSFTSRGVDLKNMISNG